jgi:hypothetical protein
MDKEAFDFVDWDSMYEAMQSFPDLYRMWVTKHVTGWCGTNRKLYLWDQRNDDICPCCDLGVVERPRHLLTCPSNSLQETWEARIEGLSEWFIESETSPDIADCFLRPLQTRDPSSSFGDFATEYILSAAKEQDSIGWFSTMEGRISYRWKFYQESYWTKVGVSKSIRKWNKDLITNLLTISHAMWTCRNTMHVHKQHRNGLPMKEGTHLQQKVTEAYEAGETTVLPEDRDQFSLSLDTILDYPHFRQQTWLGIVQQSQQDLRQLQQTHQAPPHQHTLDMFVGP